MLKITLQVLFLALLPLTDAVGQQRYFWIYEIVDNGDRVGRFTSLELNDQDQPMIAYCTQRQFYGGLKFARFDGEEWIIENVDAQAGFDSDLALDSNGNPHISYNVGQAFNELRYAFHDGTNWNKEVVDNIGEISNDTSIGIDELDRVHIAYWIEFSLGESAFQLSQTYAFSDGTGWQAHIQVDSLIANGKWSDIAFDSQGRPHISYVRQTFGNMKHAVLDNGTWMIEDIEEDDGAIDQGYNNAIVIDANDINHISFINQGENTLKYARGNFGNWTVEVVDTIRTNVKSSRTSIQLFNDNSPIIAYHNAESRDLMIAYKDNGEWKSEVVDSIGFVGEFCSMQLNSEGLPVISYFDSTRGELRLATASLTAPQDTDTDGIPDYIEMAFGTNPEDVDSDDDGLSDGEEDINLNGMVESYESNPRDSDTDGDGIQDGTELGRVTGVPPPSGISGTDPTKFIPDRDPTTTTDHIKFDTDGDGLGDGEEDINFDGFVDIFEADPNNPDSDGDGILDGVEVRLNTSPLDIDSDDDGLADGIEDKNHDGVVDFDETNPASFDTDNDNISDGVETGITEPVGDPDGDGRLAATDTSIFIADIDPLTRTDPLKSDSDGDGIIDGDEDKNQNGSFDTNETDPLDEDTDDDGLDDGTELNNSTDPLDIDSDDDGIPDGQEDLNHNGKVDPGETSPAIFDSDNDGLSDGLEIGLITGVVDPDGSGHLKATDSAIFVRDEDPETTTNAVIWDSDEDGLSDGEEDVNKNGKKDQDESDPLSSDSDGDGVNDGDEVSFMTDPIDPSSHPALSVLISDDFGIVDLGQWKIVDEGNIEAPSIWNVFRSSLVQSSNIYGGVDHTGVDDPNKPGTYIWRGSTSWENTKISFRMRSDDDDALGFMFRYSGPTSYLRFSMNRTQNFARITRVLGTEQTVIAKREFQYEIGRRYRVIVYAVGSRIQVYLDGLRLFDLNDSLIPAGAVAFYSWRNAGSWFSDLLVIGDDVTVTVSSFIERFGYQDTIEGRLVKWSVAGDSYDRIELERKNKDDLYESIFKRKADTDTWHADEPSVFLDKEPWLSIGYRLTIQSFTGEILDRKELAIAKATIDDFLLSPAYPNPFYLKSTLTLLAPTVADARLRVYNIRGQLVLTKKMNTLNPGLNLISWDGKDERNRSVPSGVYLLKLDIFGSGPEYSIIKSFQQKVLKIK